MKYSHIQFDNNEILCENAYYLPSCRDAGTLFALSNGYLGVRASLEEYGGVGIQGAYIRGVIDACPCAPVPVIENEFMKKWYFFEENIRRYQSNDTIVNFADFLFLKFIINGEIFYPWEGKILDWKRSLNLKNATLTRFVRWENSKGEITKFEFERFVSYANDNVCAIKVKITPENYDGTIEVLSGIDILTKSSGGTGGGWLLTVPSESSVEDNIVYYSCDSGTKFAFRIAMAAKTVIDDASFTEYSDEDGVLAVKTSKKAKQGETLTVEKLIFVISNRDTKIAPETVVREEIAQIEDYDKQYALHINAYNEAFSKIDVVIEGDEDADRALRFSNYHTLGSFCRNDAVHSLAPKGLSGPGYAGLVWWDCEVYQSPIFYHTMPEIAKNLLIYRYNCLDGARINAKNEGRCGARYPFNSGIDGVECCWPVARHPYMQIHIVSDVAWAINNFYNCTGDDEFMISYGMEMLYEICRYWVSRAERTERGYEIKQVAGTDEHHAFIDNNAYTNYCVKHALDRTLYFDKKYGDKLSSLKTKIAFLDCELSSISDLSNQLYLPMNVDNGLIPQFDGYFDLNRELEKTQGNGGNLKELQISSGLYHESQVIKQPDVLMLFAYQSFGFDKKVYSRNWDYYRARCESSSSLSYSVHSICASDNEEPESAYTYFMSAAMMDLDDKHNCADAGIHSACAAGAWQSVIRGIGGTILGENMVSINPHMIPWWKSLRYSLIWHGQKFTVKITNKEVLVSTDKNNSGKLILNLCGEDYSVEPGLSVKTDISPNIKCSF